MLKHSFKNAEKPKSTIYGPERARTADPLLAKQVLYQLSYRPEKWWAKEELHL